MESEPVYQGAKNLEDVLPEHELIEWSGINQNTLPSLRSKGKLPYTYLTKTCRLYFVADILDFLKSNRVDRRGDF
jgi:hypothetical protein